MFRRLMLRKEKKRFIKDGINFYVGDTFKDQKTGKCYIAQENFNTGELFFNHFVDNPEFWDAPEDINVLDLATRKGLIKKTGV